MWNHQWKSDHEDRPLLPRCDWCGRRFLPWRVPDNDWNLLSAELRPLVLCLGDYLRLLVQQGHDPDQVRVSYEPWRRLRWVWSVRSGQAVLIGFGETGYMLGRVVRFLGLRRGVVRLVAQTFTGKAFIAAWDGETHPESGVPVVRQKGPVTASRSSLLDFYAKKSPLP